ncbi:MAG: hypothetical protein HQL30_04640 [Candidatus Omnitrophica bacterium]|nr:hypothetical protein [Candidatus Omnitrophota bacterium]
MAVFNKKIIFRAVAATWVTLWLVFLIRPDKHGQYGQLARLFMKTREEKLVILYGKDFYGLLSYMKEEMPPFLSFDLKEKDDIPVNKVRARYFLWPAEIDTVAPKYRIVNGSELTKIRGYRDVRVFGDWHIMEVKGGG